MGDLPSSQDTRGIKRSRTEALSEPSDSSFSKRARLEAPQGSLYQKVRTFVGGILSWFAGTPTVVQNSTMANSSDEITIVSESKGIQVEAFEASRPSILDQVVEKDEVEVVRVQKYIPSKSFLTHSSTLGRFYGGAYKIATKEKRDQERKERQCECISRQIRQPEIMSPRTIQPSWRMGNSPNRISKTSKKFVQRIKLQPNSEWQSIAAAFQKEDMEKYRKIYERLQNVPGPIIARLTGSFSRGSTPQKGLNAITKSPFTFRKTGAITKTQYLSSPDRAESPSLPVVITLYDEDEQKDEEVVIVSTTEKVPDPDVQKMVEKFSSSIAQVSKLAQTPQKSDSPELLSDKICKDDYLTEMKSKYDVRRQAIDQQLRSEKVKRDYAQEKTERLQASMEERLRKNLTLTDVIQLEDEEEDVDDVLPPITDEMQSEINKTMKMTGKKIIEKYDTPITLSDLQTLNGLNWLNDSIINFYLQMIVNRSTTSPRYPKVYAFTTYFYPKIIQTGHSAVKRWTRKVDIFGYDLLVIPVHLEIHWCLATVDLRKKHITYYDSMLGNNYPCLNALEAYLQDEHLDKKGYPLETTGFAKTNVKDIPVQHNLSDCGMFACKFAEYLSRDAEITFSQAEMPYFRQRMKYEIITNTLIHP